MKFKSRFIVFLGFCSVFIQCAFGQLPEAELKKLMNGLDLKHQISIYDSLAIYYRATDIPASISYSNEALKVSQQNNYEYGVARSYYNRSKAYKKLGDYDKSEKDLNNALLVYVKLNDTPFIISCYNDLAGIRYVQGKYDSALSFYLKGLRLAEETKEKEMQAKCLNNIGNIYFFQENFDKAIEYYQKAYMINKEIKDLVSEALTLDNIGLVYFNKGDVDKAMLYQMSALETMERSGDKQLLAETLMNLGALHTEMKKFDAALSYFERAYAINQELKSVYGMASCSVNIGMTFRDMGKNEQAITKLTEGLKMAESIDAKQMMKEAAEGLSETYEKIHQSENALKYFKIYSNIKDSIFNEESSNKMNELTTKYDLDKKQQEIELLTKDKDLQDVKLKNQQTLSISLFVGIGLIVLLLGVMFYRYQEKRKANVLLEEKNTAIHEQKELLSEKNKEITDSINYAKRIQDAMLPSKKVMNEFFSDNFVFYEPKDIISGDFYWATEHKGCVYVAAADCTGHGVPGALMSMIGISFLRQIINENNVTDPSEILNKLHIMVVTALNEDVNRRSSKDGMDISLLKVDKNNQCVEFSGAVRPLYSIDDGVFTAIKGDRYSVAGEKKFEDSFSKHLFPMKKGTMYYMFSDGVVDQFGGPNGKKFMVKNFQEVLQKNWDKPVSEQYTAVGEAFFKWKGRGEQTDDVMVLGIRI